MKHGAHARRVALAALAIVGSVGTHAATYRCNDAGGRIVYSDRPCVGELTSAGMLTRGGARSDAVTPQPVAASASAAQPVANESKPASPASAAKAR